METLRSTVQRPLTLFSVTAWGLGYSTYLQQSLGWAYPIYFHFDGVNVTFYHTEKDFSYFKNTVTKKLLSDPALFEKVNKEFLLHVTALQNISINEHTLPGVWDLVGRVMSLYIFIVSDSFVSAQPLALESRRVSEKILYEIDEKVRKFFSGRLLDAGYDTKFALVLTQSDFEAVANRQLVVEEMENRLTGYIVHEELLYTNSSFEAFCKERDLLLQQVIVTEKHLKGNSAFPGKVQGKVVLVFTNEDAQKVKRGDVLVSPMTNANHLAAMARAGAIVTNEGGITCHAAIGARELLKPCVVGTKFATKVLQEGDLVEVDANTGIVKKVFATEV